MHRTRGRRRLSSGRAVLRVAMATAAVALALAVATSPARAAPGDGSPAGPVALVLVPELTWSGAPAGFDRFAVANLSMRSARAGSDADDNYLTLGKGGRSQGFDGGVGRVETTAGGGLRLVDWPELQRHDRSLRYGGRLGAVGQALADGGRRWALVADDHGAAAVAATADGVVPRAFPATAAGLDEALRSPLDALVVAVPGGDGLGAVLERLVGSCVLVASASTPGGSRHLGVLAASEPCRLGTGGLASPSTHHDHLATLPDVTRTFLALAGVPRPAGVGGAVVTPAPAVSRNTLVDRDERTWTADRSRTRFVWLFVGLHALGALAAVARPRWRWIVAAGLLAVAPASFLMMLVPWWRWGAGAGLVVGGVIAATVAVAGAIVGRRDRLLGIAALAGFTATVIAVDALFGSPLQIDAPFGNSPVVGGRFFGMGNIGSGFLVAGVLVAGGVAIDRWGRRSLPWVAAAMAGALVAGAAPQFGADVGGVLFAVPAYGLLLLAYRRGRVTLRHVVVLGLATAAAVGLFAAVDLLRDSDSQTHLARSVGSDGLVENVLRKGDRGLQTVKAPMANVVLIASVALGVIRPRLGGRRALRFAAAAVVVAAVLGSVLNDSGLNVAAAVLAVAWPAAMMASSDNVDEPVAVAPAVVAAT